MMQEVEITSELKQYWPELTRYARKYVGRFGAELDDLVQEGAIFVWQSLQKGITPSEDHIRNRMRNWVRTQEFQTRYGRIDEPEYHPKRDDVDGGLTDGPSEDS